ncbi:hypothetical protein EUTSA_v10022699mg [Eutrema salsugineum]|uniref:KIB1-4 beta-propeller domain-containing protein n=1 Tax=Eutrema salsugineum TaxID=72664 RepID=V4LJJ8_EUTSA|nr:F-box protein At2g17690 [Eutrema salsugineum]ESQ50715.1 hypothetical protein EUTSA_v10022699mg [Eutrema salsugineum]
MVDWSQLPERLLFMIAVRLCSVVDLFRFRSICRSWRSSVSGNEDPFPRRPLIELDPLVAKFSIDQAGNEQISGLDRGAFLSRAAFFRVALSSSSSSSSKSWLIKSDTDLRSGRLRLLNPLSRKLLPRNFHSLDLLQFTVSEIQESYAIGDFRTRKTFPGFKRVVLVSVPGGDPRIVGIGLDGKIRYWNGEIWTRVVVGGGDDEMGKFYDITVHKGLTYALDSKGVVWRISSSLSFLKFGPLLDESIITNNSCCRDKSFVECCGELYIVDRLLEEKPRERFNLDGHVPHVRCFAYVLHDDVENVICHRSDLESTDLNSPKTVGFKVYKMDEELGKWVEVNSLGDNAFLVATDCGFSVLANEFYGCLENSIYFTDKECEILVFKLDDGSITRITTPEQSCFQVFLPSFPGHGSCSASIHLYNMDSALGI